MLPMQDIHTKTGRSEVEGKGIFSRFFFLKNLNKVSKDLIFLWKICVRLKTLISRSLPSCSARPPSTNSGTVSAHGRVFFLPLYPLSSQHQPCACWGWVWHCQQPALLTPRGRHSVQEEQGAKRSLTTRIRTRMNNSDSASSEKNSVSDFMGSSCLEEGPHSVPTDADTKGSVNHLHRLQGEGSNKTKTTDQTRIQNFQVP